MKKTIIPALFFAIVLMLAGCSSVNSILESQIRKKSGIMEDMNRPPKVRPKI